MKKIYCRLPREIGWFKPEQKPVNAPGVYRTRAKFLGAGFSYFDGKQWGNQRKRPDWALETWKAFGPSGEQSKEWAGLAKPNNSK